MTFEQRIALIFLIEAEINLQFEPNDPEHIAKVEVAKTIFHNLFQNEDLESDSFKINNLEKE